MTPADFRNHGHALVEWSADYLTGSERYPVGGELLLSPQSVEIIKFGDPGSGR